MMTASRDPRSVPAGSDPAPGGVSHDAHRRDSRSRAVRCGVCMRELAQEGLHLQIAERTLGSFCSRTCLAASEALVALQHSAGELARRGRIDLAEAREALADELLALWRRRAGPDPRLVGQAVQLARARDPHDRDRFIGSRTRVELPGLD
jgi:hypothetical protein